MISLKWMKLLKKGFAGWKKVYTQIAFKTPSIYL